MQEPLFNEAPLSLSGYDALLRSLKERIQGAQLRAALALNRELVLLYWQIGREILARQHQEGWGTKVIRRLARDLRREFPELKGFSPRNLHYMRAFAQQWAEETIVQQLAAQLPWFHICTLLDKLPDPAAQRWYAQQAIEHSWSRNVMVHQIEHDLYGRQGRALTNFAQTLPLPQSDLARQVLKDPYTFDFLSLGQAAQERDLEQALTNHIRAFLLELGVGFAFVGSQYHLQVGDQDFYLDMLFYHLKLRCYVAIELKVGEFKPEYAGKMNFYLAALDDLLRHIDDQPSIGLILCKSKNQLIVEYALRDMRKPIGVAEYQLTQALPDHLKGSLPTIAELEATLTELEEDDLPESNL
jgi:predicted nuclease of restriction endonuclease-like (RecB) superfamily